MSVKTFAEAVKEGITKYTRAFGIEQAEAQEAEFVAYSAPGPSGDTTGVTDTAAINALLGALPAQGGTVQLRQGLYWVAAGTEWKLPANARLLGAGINATIIRAAAGVVHMVNGIAANTEVADLTIDANNVGCEPYIGGAAAEIEVRHIRVMNTVSNGMNIFSATDGKVVDCRFMNCGGTTASALNISKCKRMQIEGNKIASAFRGILLGGSFGENEDISITGNYITGGTSQGIICGQGDINGVIANNTIRATGDHGIDLGGSLDVSVTGNTLIKCAGGIGNDSGTNKETEGKLTIVGNTIYGTTKDESGYGFGILVGGASGGYTITGNTCVACYGPGIFVNSSTPAGGSSVTGNTCYNNGQGAVAGYKAGIKLRYTEGTVVTGNVCQDHQVSKTQTYGIELESTEHCQVVNNNVEGNLSGGVHNVGEVKAEKTVKHSNLGDATSPTLYGGEGVPPEAMGANGDIYLRGDGGAETTIYQKRAGKWVATKA